MRSDSLDVATLTKLQQTVLSLTKLKYVGDSGHYEFCLKYFDGLKAGVSTIAAAQRYGCTADDTPGRLARDPDDKSLVKIGSGFSRYLGVHKELDMMMTAQNSETNHPLYSMPPMTQIFGQLVTQCDTFFDSVGMRAMNLLGTLNPQQKLQKVHSISVRGLRREERSTGGWSLPLLLLNLRNSKRVPKLL